VSSKPVIGTCNICGAYGSLTFEHVPPRSTFNSNEARLYPYGEWLLLENTGRGRYDQQQRGSGYYALCETCNTVRGNQWYVPEYRDWVWAGAEIVLALKEQPPPPDTIIRVPLHGVRPALFAKQMVMMLLALNKPEVAASFLELQEYVCEREAVGLPSRFRLFLSLLNVEVARYGGLYHAFNVFTGAGFGATDLLYPPFAYTLTIDEEAPEPRAGEITWFTTLAPDDMRDVELRLPYNVTVMPPDELPPALG